LRNAYLNQRFPGLGLQPSAKWGAHLAALFPYTRAFAERDVRHMPAPQTGARLLDIGCGDGNFLRIATRLGYRAEGIEFDERAVAAARGQGLNVHHGGLPDTGLASASFDAVSLSQVIEHVHDPMAALRETARLLRPGGMLWVATPNVDAAGHRQFGPHWRGLEPPRHLVLFSAIALRRALAEAGFRDVRLMPAGPVTAWFFEASTKVARGLEPSVPVHLSAGASLRAHWTDFQAYLHPELGEELIIVGKR
jgi:SAM-dependent methyltransferase